MNHYKAAVTPNVVGLKLRKEDCNKNVNLILDKRTFGSLMYLTTTRPDIMYVVILISRSWRHQWRHIGKKPREF